MLAVCAATELNPRYGRLYAYLQDDVTRKLPSPRLVGQLLEGEGLSLRRRDGARSTPTAGCATSAR